MKISISIGAYNRVDVLGMVEYIQRAERLGVSHAWPAEAWGRDAVTALAFRGEKLRHEGKHFTLPLPHGEGNALPLDHPPMDIPIYPATLGPKSLEFTGASAESFNCSGADFQYSRYAQFEQ
jgi:alkanesulfonate monooxygenase SsuD/methylene tetrahydromethanopterin reductase-like flavin-dependent oxidoreductase (luciferase family)